MCADRSSAALAALLVAARYADGGYPAGGFANSWGIETACALGQVTDAPSLARTAAALLRHQVAPTDAVAAAACCRAAVALDGGRFLAVDARLTVTRVAREAREASTRMGRRLLETAARAERDDWLGMLWQQVRAGQTAGNHAAALGAVLGRRGLTPDSAAAVTLWSALTGYLNAAVRLIPVTHDDTQGILTELLPLCVDLAAGAAEGDPLTMAGSLPVADLWSMLHESAVARLFAS